MLLQRNTLDKENVLHPKQYLCLIYSGRINLQKDQLLQNFQISEDRVKEAPRKIFRFGDFEQK